MTRAELELDVLDSRTEPIDTADEQVRIDFVASRVAGSLVCQNETCEPSLNEEVADDPAEIQAMERDFEAIEYIRSRYALSTLSPMQRALAPLLSPMHYVEQIGNQFAKKIIRAYTAEDTEEGLQAFRQIVPHTTQEEMVLLVTDDQFRDIYGGTKLYLLAKEADIAKAVEERLDPEKGSIAINDRLQFRGKETKSSLENILRSGVRLSLEPEAIGELREVVAANDSGSIPVTEQIKNLRLVNINGFKDSKISLVAHDVMDHAWTFELMQRKGLLDDYRDLLQSIGNPHLTNIFFREGEAVASIAFGVRYWSTIEPGFKPVYSSQRIARMMEEHFDTGRLSEERHMRSYRVMRSLAKDPSTREAQSLGFSFSNYITELDEQRRKHGKIKQKDLTTGKVIGELDPLSPDFLSLFIEVHHEILNSKNKHRNDLFVFHIILEEFLQDVGSGKLPDSAVLNIRVQDLRTRDMTQVKLPPERLHWMFRNHGFTSTKDSIY